MRLAALIVLVLASFASADDKKGPTVTEFKPNTAFRAYAAKVLGANASDIDGGAIDAATAAGMPDSIGGAWAYTVWLKSDRNREVRGWVTADGTVVSPAQNLGVLFKEAGTWGKVDDLDALADKLAASITWSYGTGYTVVNAVPKKMPPPTLALAHGAGKLVFFTSYKQPGPGGAGGGPLTYAEIDVALTADHKATLTKTAK